MASAGSESAIDDRGAVPPADGAARRSFAWVASGILGIWALHNGLLLPWELRTLDGAVREPLLIALRAVLWMVPVLAFLGRHDPRRRLVALGVTSRVSWRGVGMSTLLGLAYLALVTLLLRATAELPSTAAPDDLLGTLLTLHGVYMLATVVLEELLMRGFLLRQLVRFTSSRWAQACVALVFAFMHLPGWLAMGGLQIELVPSLISLVLLGAVLGGVTQLSRSILPAIVVHFLNNVLAEWLGGG